MSEIPAIDPAEQAAPKSVLAATQALRESEAALKKSWEQFKETHDAAAERDKRDIVFKEKIERIDAAVAESQKNFEELSRSFERSKALRGPGGDAFPAAPPGIDFGAEAAHIFSLIEGGAPGAPRISPPWLFDAKPGEVAEATKKGRLAVSAFRRYLKHEIRHVGGSLLQKHDAAVPDLTFAVAQEAFQPAAGYLVPVFMTNRIIDKLYIYGSLRAAALVRTIPMGATVQLAYMTGEVTSRWGRENIDRRPGDLPRNFRINYDIHDHAITVAMTNDQMMDAPSLEAYLQMRVTKRMAEDEADAHINGDGVARPTGLMSIPFNEQNDDVRPIGTWRYLRSGAAATIGSNPDALIRMVYDLHQVYRPRAMWLMNRYTIGLMRAWKDSEGQYYWMPGGIMEGAQQRYLGYPIMENDHMPSQAANARPIAFGDFMEAYEIGDRAGLTLLVDPYTGADNNQTKFRFLMRTGGRPADTRALRFLQCRA